MFLTVLKYNKIILSVFFLTINFLFLSPLFTNAQTCLNANGVQIKGVTESECSGRNGNWTLKPLSTLISCNRGGKIYQTTVSECNAFGGTTVPNETTATQNSNTATKSATAQTYFMPGVTKNTSIPEYVKAVYNYALGVVGIIATIVIMIAGLIWITSMGNASRVNDAKDWIIGALTGLALAMFSWTILYIINEDLVNFKFMAPKAIESAPTAVVAKQDSSVTGCCYSYDTENGGSASNTQEKDCTGSSFIPGYSANTSNTQCVAKPAVAKSTDTCEKYGTANVINFSTVVAKDPAVCDKFDSEFQAAAAKYNIDYKLIKAVATQESGCNPSAISSSNACGVMQLKPGTASTVSGTNIDCSTLTGDYRLNIDLGAKYLAQNRQSNLDDWIAGYNGGYGTGINPVTKKLGPLAKSVDCAEAGSDVKAYQCCKKPDELAQTQDYVFKVKGYYNGE